MSSTKQTVKTISMLQILPKCGIKKEALSSILLTLYAGSIQLPSEGLYGVY